MAGYTTLATLMGTHHELALMRKFATLNVKNLLYMQAELTHLEAELGNIELENGRTGDPNHGALLVSVFDLKESTGTTGELQWQKALEIRGKLRCHSLFVFSSTASWSNLRKLIFCCR